MWMVFSKKFTTKKYDEFYKKLFSKEMIISDYQNLLKEYNKKYMKEFLRPFIPPAIKKICRKYKKKSPFELEYEKKYLY